MQATETKPRPFHEMPDDFRASVRDAINRAGGMVAGYYDGYCQVALPADREACIELTEAMKSLGMIGEQRFTWFPLGSDNPPASLRHHGIGTAACPRGDRPSYWKYRNFFVA